MQSIDSLYESWSAPTVNWFDYFVDRKRLESLLADVQANKDTIASLALQFGEQAVNSEKESDILLGKNFPNEDVSFSKTKAACLWLCCLSCLAALNWDFRVLVDKQDVLAVRPIIDHVERLWQSAEISNDSTFGSWIMCKWILFIDQKFRIIPPPPKQIVNNPSQLPDANIARHEHIRKAVVEIRERLSYGVGFFENLTVANKSIFVYGPKCFLKPFMENSGMSLSVGILGHNVLAGGPPTPNLSHECSLLDSKDVTANAHYELLHYYFADGVYSKAKSHLKRISTNSSTHQLISIDTEKIGGYCIALNVSCPFPIQGPSKTSVTDQKFLSDDSSVYRRRKFFRWKAENESSGQLQVAFRSENIAREIVECLPTACSGRITDKVMLERVVKSMVRQREKTRKTKDSEALFRARIRFMCTVVTGFSDELLRNGFTEDDIGPTGITTEPADKNVMIPGNNILKAFLMSEDPVWRLITSFDVVEIKEAFTQCKMFHVPHRLRFPELLGDYVLIGRPINELHALILGKLHQLYMLGNQEEWQVLCNKFVTELGQVGRNNQLRFVKEAVHVQAAILNRKLLVSYEYLSNAQLQHHLKTIKGLFGNSPTITDTPHSTELCRQVIALCLNTKDWEFVLNKLDQNSPLITFTKLMAAYGAHQDTPSVVKITEAFHHEMAPLFEHNGTKRRNDGRSLRETSKGRNEIIQLLRLLKEPSLISYLISFFAFLFNKALVYARKSQLRVFVHHADLMVGDGEINNVQIEAVEECLQIVLNNGLTVNPINAFWLRTAADYRYAKNEVNEASKLYMEVILACNPSFTPPFPDNIIDNSIWNRLRVCLGRFKHHTLALLLTQFVKDQREEEYVKAIELVSSQVPLDCGEECVPMVFDHTLAEYLMQAYEHKNQHNNMDRLITWIAKYAMNPNNRTDIFIREQARRAERLLQVVATQLFSTHL